MLRTKSKRQLICLGFTLIILFITAPLALAADKPPIKIGLLLPYTGTMPLQAKGVSDGVELYLDEIGRKAGGASHPGNQGG